MGNTQHEPFAGISPDSHSIIVPVNYFQCQCDINLLKGSHRGRLFDMLRAAVEGAGFGVIGDSTHPFGSNTAERNVHGSTLNLILEDSGISFDCYPEVMTVQSNLHYCNITNCNDKKVLACIKATKAVLQPMYTCRYPDIKMPIVWSSERGDEAMRNGAQFL